MELLLAGPRAFCAGVERAIDIVRILLERQEGVVYVRRQIVHNVHVVRELEEAGAVFVEELDEVPDGVTVVFSAHGVSPAVRAEAERRRLRVVDATCPLVAKVHAEARRFAARGDTIVLIGHPGHDEAVGTMGEAPTQTVIVETVEDVERLEIDGPVSYLMQTTLALDDAAPVLEALRLRFPGLRGPHGDDICYATTNRQQAVREVAADADVVLVLGSANSANSIKLMETARRQGARSYLVDDASQVRPEWLEGARVVGVTAGASASPALVDELVTVLRARGADAVVERVVVEETVTFAMPRQLRTP